MGRFKEATLLSRAFATLVVMNFVFSLEQASVAYVSSSFLSRFLNPTEVSIVFSLSALLIIGALAVIPTILRATGVRRLMIVTIPVLQLVVLLIAFAQNAVQAIVFFALQGILILSLSYLLDLYVEKVTKSEDDTGGVRSMFLTSGNLATFFAPLAIALFVVGTYYPPLFAFAAIILTVTFVLALTSLKHLSAVIPKRSSFKEALARLWCCQPSIACVMGTYFLLQIFFSWVIVYVPLYLLGNGYSWQTIGLVTAFALFPYLVIEIPLGYAADHWWGETEIMAIGFGILALSTASLSFIPVSLIVLWAFAYFATRIGASMVEIASETYFFKQVTADDSALVSIFRMMRSVGAFVGPLVAILFLPLTGLQYLFGIFGAILLIGVPLALRIVDTK